MPALLSTTVSAAAGTTTGRSLGWGLEGQPQQLGILWAVQPGTTGATVTCSSATVLRVSQQIGTTLIMECWVIYNVAQGVAAPVVVLTMPAGGTGVLAVYECPGLQTSAPTVTTASSSGTSVTPDSGLVAASVGDILFLSGSWNANNTATGSADTPGAPNSPFSLTSTGAAGYREETLGRVITVASSYERTWTITSAGWLGAALAITPITTATAASLAYKGRDTATADQGATA